VLRCQSHPFICCQLGVFLDAPESTAVLKTVTNSCLRREARRPIDKGQVGRSYRPDFPDRFGSIEHARAHCTDFFSWYNTEHRHSGLGLHRPHDVHFALAEARRDRRAAILTAAYVATPERFVRRPPTPAPLPTAAWINPPKPLAPLHSEDVAQ